MEKKACLDEAPIQSIKA